jgi:putative membrane protein
MAAWSFQPPSFLILAVAGLYVLGGRWRVGSRRRRRRDLARSAAFWGGLLTIVVALDSPLDGLVDRLFAAHMTQHVLLLTVAPPLIVLGAPWMRIWRPLPLGFRRSVAKALVVDPRTRLLRRLATWVTHPVVVWLLFSVNLVAWHIPAAYDLTLTNGRVHDLEHALFLTTGVLLWLQIVPSPPFHVRLDEVRRAAYATAAMLVGWILAIVLAFAPHPLYAHYAQLGSRPGGLSALADQQIAAGVMWVPGSLTLTLAALVLLYRWLAPETSRTSHRAAVLAATPSSATTR